jgi:malate dehydrogenase
MQSNPLDGTDCWVKGTNNYEDTADSDVCIVTAGIARKPGMSRDDLLNTNYKIVSIVAENLARYSPNTCIIVVSNPLDVMTIPPGRPADYVQPRIWSSGVLESARVPHLCSHGRDRPSEDVNA